MCLAQIVVQGISWKSREEQLRELFGEIGDIESASVVMGRDGRSRVRFCSDMLQRTYFRQTKLSTFLLCFNSPPSVVVNHVTLTAKFVS